jgi:predicted secreted hydrolase
MAKVETVWGNLAWHEYGKERDASYLVVTNRIPEEYRDQFDGVEILPPQFEWWVLTSKLTLQDAIQFAEEWELKNPRAAIKIERHGWAD